MSEKLDKPDSLTCLTIDYAHVCTFNGCWSVNRLYVQYGGGSPLFTLPNTKHAWYIDTAHSTAF